MAETNLKVKLINHTLNPEKAIALAAKVCYSPIGIDELNEEMVEEDALKLLKRIIKAGHWSAVEHASFTFAIEGISRTCSHQLVRHRLASYNQQSQRYVQFHEDIDYIIPDSIKKHNVALYYDAFLARAAEVYATLCEHGVPAEDARFVLPSAVETKIVVTMNARELFHFFKLRCCGRAQWEIRAMAMAMLAEVQKIAPTLFETAGATCLTKSCEEGGFTCGEPWKKIHSK